MHNRCSKMFINDTACRWEGQWTVCQASGPQTSQQLPEGFFPFFSFFFFFFFFFCFLGSHSRHMKVPRLGVKSELQLQAYTETTATPDPSRICDLRHNSWQHWILDPLSDARDRTSVLMDTSWIHFLCATMGTPPQQFLNVKHNIFKLSYIYQIYM